MAKQSQQMGPDIVTTSPDPTFNVSALVNAAVKRLDDIAELKEIHLRELVILHSQYQEKLAVAESKRLDSNRTVDLQAVSIASERAAAQAAVLASQVTTANETNRNLMLSQDSRIATVIQVVENKLSDRVSVLEKSAYEGVGKQKMTDPMMDQLIQEIRTMKESGERRAGSTTGSASMWGYVVGAIGALLGLSGLVMSLAHVVK